jgi:hypothetical protein
MTKFKQGQVKEELDIKNKLFGNTYGNTLEHKSMSLRFST